MKKIKIFYVTLFTKKTFSLGFVLIFIISLFPIIPLFTPGLPSTHDSRDHVARIANFYESLSEGNIIPRWADKLNWGYGHPILMFLYPLPSYLGSFIHYLGFSFVDTVKVVFCLCFVLSGLTMYLYSSAAFGVLSGVVISTLYLFAPYRFVDMYVRGALGEHVAFVFPPLICLFLLKLTQKKEIKSQYISLVGISVSMALLILSHNAVSLMFLPFFGFYIWYLRKIISDKKSMFVWVAFLGVFIGFILSGFFWLPALIEGKYTLRNIVTNNIYDNRFVSSLWNFIYMPWSYGQSEKLSKEIGLLQIGGWLSSLWLVTKKNSLSIENKYFVRGLSTFIILSIFLMLPVSTILWQKISILGNFQFPWRFLAFTTFATSVLGGWSIVQYVKYIPGRFLKLTVVSSVIIFSFFTTRYMWKPIGYLIKPESYYTGVFESTTDTGESSPIWSVRFMETRPAAPVEIIEGNGSIYGYTRTTSQRNYFIDAESSVRVLENTLYFPGWRIYVDKKEVIPEFQDSEYRGLMTYFVPSGKHEIMIKFVNTKVRRISEIITLTGLVVLLGSVFCLQLYTRKIR